MSNLQPQNPLSGNLYGGTQSKDILELIVNDYFMAKLITGAGKEIFQNTFPILSNLAIFTYERYKENRDYREAVGNFSYARMHQRTINALKASGQWQSLTREEENKAEGSLLPMPLGSEYSGPQIQSNKYELTLRKSQAELAKNDKLIKHYMAKYFEENQDGSYWDKNIDLAMQTARTKGNLMAKNDFELAKIDWVKEEQKLLEGMKNAYKRKLQPHEVEWARKEIDLMKEHADKAKKRIQTNNAELTKDLLKSMQLGSLEDDICNMIDAMKVVDSDSMTEDGVRTKGGNKSELILEQIKALLRDYTKEISNKKLKVNQNVINADKEVGKLIVDQEAARKQVEEENKIFNKNLEKEGDDLEQKTKITFYKEKRGTNISWQEITQILKQTYLNDGDTDFQMPRPDFELYKKFIASLQMIQYDQHKHQIMRAGGSSFSYKRKYVTNVLDLYLDEDWLCIIAVHTIRFRIAGGQWCL